MPQLAGKRVGTPINLAAPDDAAADAGRERHVEEWIRALAGPEVIFAQSAHIRVVIDHGPHAHNFLDPVQERKRLPPGDMRR